MFLHFLQSQEHKVAFLKLAHFAANADGFVARNEQGYLRSYMNEMNMEGTEEQFRTEEKLADLIGGIQDQQVRYIFFAEILLLIFADGDYNENEKQIVKDLQEQFGIPDEICETFKNWVIRVGRLKIEGFRLILDPANVSQPLKPH